MNVSEALHTGLVEGIEAATSAPSPAMAKLAAASGQYEEEPETFGDLLAKLAMDMEEKGYDMKSGKKDKKHKKMPPAMLARMKGKKDDDEDCD